MPPRRDVTRGDLRSRRTAFLIRYLVLKQRVLPHVGLEAIQRARAQVDPQSIMRTGIEALVDALEEKHRRDILKQRRELQITSIAPGPPAGNERYFGSRATTCVVGHASGGR